MKNRNKKERESERENNGKLDSDRKLNRQRLIN